MSAAEALTHALTDLADRGRRTALPVEQPGPVVE
jgi:hypothetical protein